MDVVIVMHCQSDILEIVRTLHTPSGLSRRLNRRKEKTD